MYCTWKNIKSQIIKKYLKKLAPTWNKDFELIDGSYSVSDIQEYFEYILKEYRKNINDNNPTIRISKNHV